MRITLMLAWAIEIMSGLSSAQTNQPAGSLPAFSIVAWDSITGDIGVAVIAHSLAGGAVIPYAKSGVGAIASQGAPNPAYGMLGIDLLEQGKSAQQAVESLLKSDSAASRRQLGVVDFQGRAFAYTGVNCSGISSDVSGRGYSVQGSGLAAENVIKSMARTFEISSGDLADRLLGVLEAGIHANGERRGMRSAALLVVREGGGFAGLNDRMVDLRIDDDSLPLSGIRHLYGAWQKAYLPEVLMRSVASFNEKKNFAAAQELTGRMVIALNAQLRDKPDDPEVLNNVARALTTNNIDRNRALELAKRAAKLAPGKLNILDTLAECHFQLGHFDEAIAIGSELVAKDPANDEYWRQLKKFKEAKEPAAK